MENDIRIAVPGPANNQISFNVVEIGRQVKFKEAKPKSSVPDSLQQEVLKIKVLHGKFYENSKEAAVDKDAIPVFEVPEAPVTERQMINGNYYVVIGVDSLKTEALKFVKIAEESAITAILGYNEVDRTYYVYTNYYQNKRDAWAELSRIRKVGFKDAEVIKFE
jgi:hypothetical protein